jgi:hypothetical protein
VSTRQRSRIDHLKKLTTGLSVTLAANNHYTLDEAALDMVLDKHDADKAARIVVQQRKDTAKSK